MIDFDLSSVSFALSFVFVSLASAFVSFCSFDVSGGGGGCEARLERVGDGGSSSMTESLLPGRRPAACRNRNQVAPAWPPANDEFRRRDLTLLSSVSLIADGVVGDTGEVGLMGEEGGGGCAVDDLRRQNPHPAPGATELRRRLGLGYPCVTGSGKSELIVTS